MKLTLFVAALVLALAHGSLAQEADFSQISERLQQLGEQMTQKFTDLVNNPSLQEHAQTLRAQIEPLTAQFAQKMETDIKPMVSQMQQQFEEFLQRVREQTPALN